LLSMATMRRYAEAALRRRESRERVAAEEASHRRHLAADRHAAADKAARRAAHSVVRDLLAQQEHLPGAGA